MIHEILSARVEGETYWLNSPHQSWRPWQQKTMKQNLDLEGNFSCTILMARQCIILSIVEFVILALAFQLCGAPETLFLGKGA